MLRYFILFLLTIAINYGWAESEPTSNNLLSLSKAKELGRTKSSFLIPKETKKAKSNLAPTANLEDFKNHIAPMLEKNCLDCHGPKKAKAKFRVDQLDPNLLKGQDIAKWLEVYEVLSNSEMPPDDEPDYHLDDKNRSIFVDWLGDEMNKAAEFRRNEGGHSSFRRMTKFEYNNALQDLLGKPWNFADELPPETFSEDGFTNSSEHLNMTAMQFEAYRKLALKALKKVTFEGEQPPLVVYNITMDKAMALSQKRKKKSIDSKDKDFKKKRNRVHIFNKETGIGQEWGWAYNKAAWHFKPDSDYVPLPQNPKQIAVLPRFRSNQDFMPIDLGNFLPDAGTLRIRIRAGRTTHVKNQFSGIQIFFGSQTSNNAYNYKIVTKDPLKVTAPADKPEYVTLEIPLSEIPRNPFRATSKLGSLPNPAEVLRLQHISTGRDKDGEPLEIHIDHIEISGPIYEQWPPKSHVNIFPDSKLKDQEKEYGKLVIGKFLRKAWRRPITDSDISPFLGLFEKYRPEFPTFEGAMLEVLATILATPEFLYIVKESPQATDSKEISQLELASRMSYFLWSSLPDEELIKLAQSQKLNDPAVLDQQINRMLSDSRAKRFSKNFTYEWLGLKAIDHVNIVPKVFGSFRYLKDHLMAEPVAFFEEVLKNNSSIIDFIHSDYLVISERMSHHYRIWGVYGPHFRKVKVNPKHNRGGILTSAAVLAMNSDGKDSHPLKRGIWLLEKILHDPPPPPPPNVPEVDLTNPRILQMTLKERLADHRNHPACKSCHMKIDPWGIAFENYDAVGRFRTDINKKPVDSTSTLLNKQKLDGINGLKHYLLSDRQDQFAKAMVYKMVSYALGRPLSFGDYADIEEMTMALRKNGDGLKDMVSIIIKSKLFHTH